PCRFLWQTPAAQADVSVGDEHRGAEALQPTTGASHRRPLGLHCARRGTLGGLLVHRGGHGLRKLGRRQAPILVASRSGRKAGRLLESGKDLSVELRETTFL